MKKISKSIIFVYIISGIVGGVSLFLDCKDSINGDFLVFIKSMEWISILVMISCMIYFIYFINIEDKNSIEEENL